MSFSFTFRENKYIGLIFYTFNIFLQENEELEKWVPPFKEHN